MEVALVHAQQLEQRRHFGTNRPLERRLALWRPLGGMRRRDWNPGLSRGGQLRRVNRADVQQDRRHAGETVFSEILDVIFCGISITRSSPRLLFNAPARRNVSAGSL
jgi:hypothetical protein